MAETIASIARKARLRAMDVEAETTRTSGAADRFALRKNSMRSDSRLWMTTIGLLVVCTFPSTMAAEPQWWTNQKRACGLNPSLDYNSWLRQGSPCRSSNAGNSNIDYGAAQRAQAPAAAAAEGNWKRDAELERQRIEIEEQRQIEEAEKEAQFDRNKQEALGQLNGLSIGGDFDSGLKDLSAADSGLKDASAPGNSEGLKTSPERLYTFAGNGMIGGTTWTVYASRRPGEAEKRMCDAIKQQAKLAGANYDAGIDCIRYQFVLGIAASVDPFTDLNSRVAFDDLTNGQFSANAQGLYDKLRGKQFDELGCHSNGAMICLAALENRDIQAVHVVLYGPQVTRESLEMWNKLVQDGRVKSVKVYLNENDPVPGASIAYADYKKNQAAEVAAMRSTPTVDTLIRASAKTAATAASEVPLFQVDSLKRTINESGPRLEVQTFPCKLEMSHLGCHEMAMYKSKVNCSGKSSGTAVPGTGYHGKDDLPEPPLPCDSIGSVPR